MTLPTNFLRVSAIPTRILKYIKYFKVLAGGFKFASASSQWEAWPWKVPPCHIPSASLLSALVQFMYLGVCHGSHAYIVGHLEV